MGQQQVLLIILSVILVGIAVTVGISMFRAYSITANQDAMILDIINISTTAYQYRMKPLSMGGGSGSYHNFEIPPLMDENDNAEYALIYVPGSRSVVEGDDYITIEGRSRLYPNAIIRMTYNSNFERIGEIEKEGWPN